MLLNFDKLFLSVTDAALHFDKLITWINAHCDTLANTVSPTTAEFMDSFPAPKDYKVYEQLEELHEQFLQLSFFNSENANKLYLLASAIGQIGDTFYYSCHKGDFSFSEFFQEEPLSPYYDDACLMMQDFTKGRHLATDIVDNSIQKHFPEVVDPPKSDEISFYRIAVDCLIDQEAKEHVSKPSAKLNWQGTAKEAAFIFDLLAESGYIDSFQDNTQKARALMQLFHIRTDKGEPIAERTLQDYFGRNKMADPLKKYRMPASINIGKRKDISK